MKRYFVFCIFWLPLFAVDVGGEITENTVWGPTGNPPDTLYNLIAPVYILDNVTLTIQPGVKIQSDVHHFSVYGSIIACGTPEEKIRFTSRRPQPNPGDWEGLHFGSVSDSSLFSHCIIEYATCAIQFASNLFRIENSEISHCNDGMYVNNGAKIQNCVISNNTHWGIFTGNVDDSLPVIIENCTISNNQIGIEIFGPVLPQFPQPNIISNNTCNIEIFGCEVRVSDEKYWNPASNGIDCFVRENIRIEPNGKLIIGPGNVFKFDTQRRILIEGQLIANGTSANQIIFTSAKPSPAPGDWYGLEGLSGPFADTCIINNCIIEYAGSAVYGGPFRIENSIIRYCNWFGIGGVGIINNTEIHSNECGIQFWGGYLFINGSTIRNNNYGIFIDYLALEPHLPYFPVPNQFLNNTFDIYAYSGDFYIRDDHLWRPSLEGVDFYLNGNFLRVDTTGIFRVAPGNRFLMNQGAIFVSGKIIAQGTPDKMIIFTSEGQSPHPGDWMQIWITSQSETSYFSNCKIEYASSGIMGGNFIVDSSIIQHCYIGIALDHWAEIFNSNISNNIRSGIECYGSDSMKIIGNSITNDSFGVYCIMGANPLITLNAINNNIKYGVFNEDNNYWIYAENNWWGDSTGPRDTSDVDTLYNPGGLGDRVSDHVDYEPWLMWPVHINEKNPHRMDIRRISINVYPNPFRNRLDISFHIADQQLKGDDNGYICHIKIYDITGRLVKSFDNIILKSFNKIVWDGMDNAGKNVSAGVYICRIEGGGANHTLKVIKIN